ncbi:MAG: O-acetyltransferase WecH [Sodalis sp.]|nr:MAG: O-acetyltransferase WecH [Sodalis sp.]
MHVAKAGILSYWYFHTAIILYSLSPLILIKALNAGLLAVIILLVAVLTTP